MSASRGNIDAWGLQRISAVSEKAIQWMTVRSAYGTSFMRPEDAARLSFSSTREDVLRGRAIDDRLAEGLFRVP
jgi:hypothetical protein